MDKTGLAIGEDTSLDQRVTFTRQGLFEGARQTVPVALSIFAYGLVFGVLARQAGLSTAESLLMSGIVFAGSSQFAAIGLWVAPLPVAAIVLTTLVVNLRQLLMGAALRPWFAALTRPQLFLSLFVLNDESWALTMGSLRRGSNNGAFLLGSGLVSMMAWLSATLVGGSLGNALQDPGVLGLDFAFTEVFIGLLVGFWKGRSDLLPWGVAALFAVFAAMYLPGKWYIIVGGIAGSVAGALKSDS
ncbi:MAG: AzlC family ABC transporter permease [Chloroflexota bacterium]